MRHPRARILLTAAALFAGMAWLTQAGAADPTADHLKALVEQDAKAIAKATDAVAKAPAGKQKTVAEKNAGSAIKSSALILAALANNQITGKDPAADAKAAAVRDEALKLFKAASDKKFPAAAEIGKGLATAKPAAKAEKIDITKELGELTSGHVMDNFKTTANYGTNVEADIKANAKKKGPAAKPADVALMVHRVLVMGELSKTITKTAEGNAGEKKEWLELNEKMIKAAEGLGAAAQKKASPADMAKAFTVLDSSCNACHDKFKN